MQAAAVTLKNFGIPYEAKVVSAHRTPDLALEYAATRQRARHQGADRRRRRCCPPGRRAGGQDAVPVLGVPMPSKHLAGFDSLLSMVQMPGGIPVATFAIGEAGATNAALFAVAMLALNDAAVAAKLSQLPPPADREGAGQDPAGPA